MVFAACLLNHKHAQVLFRQFVFYLCLTNIDLNNLHSTVFRINIYLRLHSVKFRSWAKPKVVLQNLIHSHWSG